MTAIDTAVPAHRDGSRLAPEREVELEILDYLRKEGDAPLAHPRQKTLAALTIGAVGVAYGDIGTSTHCAFRKALRPVVHSGAVTVPGELGILCLRPAISVPSAVEGVGLVMPAPENRMATDPSEFYHLPRDGVVELGKSVAV